MFLASQTKFCSPPDLSEKIIFLNCNSCELTHKKQINSDSLCKTALCPVFSLQILPVCPKDTFTYSHVL